MTKQEKEEVANMFGWQFAQRLEDEERARKSRNFAKIVSAIGLSSIPPSFLLAENSLENLVMELIILPFFLLACFIVLSMK